MVYPINTNLLLVIVVTSMLTGNVMPATGDLSAYECMM